MEKDDTVYLRHILDAIDTVQEYLLRVDEEKFKATQLLQDGVIRQIEIVGEAVRHVSKDIRRTYAEVPWQDISGMRDKLIHDFLGSISKRFGILRSKIYLFLRNKCLKS